MTVEAITLTNINIRQSITILLAKLISTDFVLASLVIAFYWLVIFLEDYIAIRFARTFLFLIIFALAGGIKIALTIFVILQWLNEYYEITPTYIYHKKGIIFREVKEFRIDMIRRIDVKDTFLGEIFNFATITAYDVRLNRLLDMYLIHNPDRYVKILKQVRPEIETEMDHTRLPFLNKEETNVDYE